MTSEKMAVADEKAGAETPPSFEAQDLEHDRPQGKPWMYKKIFGFIPGYATPEFQVVYVAFVCFMCPGMYNAVSGLGAGGGMDPYDVNRSSIGLYATFSIFGFFGGTVANKIGLRLTLAFGGFGYCIYLVSLLVYKHTRNAGFLIFAGCLLGACAGLLWTAQGAIMTAYPLEKQKGRFIAIFWVIFNLGAVIGALIPLAQNMHSTAPEVNDGTYYGFIALMLFGFLLSCGLCNPHFVIRKDGSRVMMMKQPTWKSEFIGLFETLRTDWYIVFLFPFFLASNWFYTYHFQDVNFAYFNVRTRSLNSVLYWSMQMVGAAIFGYALDMERFSRRARAKGAIAAIFTLTMVIWGGGFKFQQGYNREMVGAEDYVKKDFQDSGYVGPMFLYMFYGFYDAAFQTTAYWIIGTLSNNGRKLANIVGFYKGIQSAGGSIAPSIDAEKVSFMSEFATNWGLLAGSILIAAPVVWLKVTDTTSIEKDLEFVDERKEDVVATHALPAAKH